MATSKGPRKPTRQQNPDNKKIEKAYNDFVQLIKDCYPKGKKDVATYIDAQSFLVYDSDHEEAREFVMNATSGFRQILGKLKSTAYYSTKPKRAKR